MRFFLTIFFLIINVSCSTADAEISVENLYLANETILYKQTNSDSNLTSLDVYTVKNSTAVKPVVIWIHGGAWVTGDKANDMIKKAPFFNNLGYVFVSVNYRLSPFPYETDNNLRIKHPAHIIDVADALHWIANNIHKYGGDASKITLMGHSAGAHLVALAATNQQFFVDRSINFSSIKGVVSLDTQAYNVPLAVTNSLQTELYINAFSNDLETQKDASPFYQLDNYSTTVKNWLFASRGTSFRKEILNDFVTKLQTKNAVTKVVSMDAYTHEEVNDLIADTSNSILSTQIKLFLQTVFN